MLMCMKVTIPHATRSSPTHPEPADQQVDTAVAPSTTQGPPGVRVLLVEDNPVISQIAKVVLRADPRLDLVGAASSVGDAIVWLRAHDADAILLDHDLPDGDAGDVLAVLGDPRRVRVVLHTGRADADALHRRLRTDAVAMKGGDWRTICDELARGRRQ